MNRRSYLLAAGASASALLTGCMGDDDSESTDDPEETTTTDPDDGATTTEDPNGADDTAVDEQSALSVVDAYITAATEGDFDTLARTMHSAHPFNPENLSEEEREQADFEGRSVEDDEQEIIDTVFETDDVVAALSDSTVFEGENVSDLVEGEQATLVEINYEADADSTETTRELIMLTEDGKWRVLWPYHQQETLPQGEAEDTYDIVDSVEYETEDERVRVNMSGTAEITAEGVTVYTESAGEANRAWAPDSEALPDVNYLTAPFDSDGDEVVVTITVDGEEIVIYRDEYSPE